EHLGVSERTIERDLIDLQALPYSLPLEKAGWHWRLDRARAIPLPPIALSREQAAALYLGARLLMQHSGPITALAQDAVGKLAEALPLEVGSYLLQAPPIAPTPQSPATQAIFSALVTGWIERRIVLCIYQRRSGAPRTYRFAPYA